MSWTDHFVKQNYEGRWDVLPLRHQPGATHPISAEMTAGLQAYTPPDATEFVDAAVLAETPYFREVLAEFDCPLKAVRLMRLAPGPRIKGASRPRPRADWGEARIHIPITTNPASLSCSIGRLWR